MDYVLNHWQIIAIALGGVPKTKMTQPSNVVALPVNVALGS